MQTVFVILLFVCAVGYMASRAYKTVIQRDTGCGKGCGCSADSRPGTA